MDPRYEELARGLTGFSVNVKKGEHVLIDAGGIPEEMVIALVREVRKRGGVPHVSLRNERVSRELLIEGTNDQYGADNAWELFRMKKMDAYIALRGSGNVFETADIPSEKMKMYSKKMKPTLDYRVKKTKWCILRWPNPSMAQQAKMSTEAFRDFYFNVCTLDYAKMKPGMAALKRWMEKTDEVRIKGPGTDLRFSIKGISAIPCGGQFNIPDGEVFTAPVKDSVEGTISHNAPTVYQGVAFEKISLTFKKGKIVEATGSDTKRLNQILDSDPGARYIGEFAIGFNPHIREPMGDILFDEKIDGSFHFTPGQAYEEADNGNRSQVHWDMVSIQRKEFGGGEIWFDGKLIRKDGVFVPAGLKKLNREALL
ncbi:aminopeptidase [Puniceicoccus vermicola]|uniref:Aminopeptidase n=1 Tax=Puniceicoccus vermicola TaxID=388746 RepID=A0A7X1E3M7_9BACT|nr:aminopeptidase [Puniceicoccus vermicola]MBC2601221.1 aminopeptidase [Puniceicoccus vermicola]